MRVDRHSIRPLDRKQTFLLVAQYVGGGGIVHFEGAIISVVYRIRRPRKI